MEVTLLLCLGLLFALFLGVDLSHTLTLSWSRSGESIAQTVTLSADGEANRNVTINAATSNVESDIVLDVSALTSVYMLSDKTITLKTNSSGSPDDTITLTAGKPVIWYTGCGWTNPLTVDVTKFYLSNAGGTAAAFQARFLYDSTP